MKFKQLKKDEEKLAYFTKVYKDNSSYSWDERMGLLMEMTGKSERTVRKWAEKLGLTENKEKDSEELIEAKKRVFNKDAKRFFITWAQCNTPLHERMFKCMEGYAVDMNADIHVIAGRYKNPTSIYTSQDESADYRWDSRVYKYLDANRHDVHKYVSIMSDIKIQPTATNPMTGLTGVSGINSCVFGAPKMQLETIPVLEGNKPKMMVTSGACTVENYTDSKAGKKGEFHHQLGFVIVEIKDDETFFIRQVTVNDDGSFYDLYNHVSFDGEKVDIKFEDVYELIDWKFNNFNREPKEWVGKVKIKQKKKTSCLILGDLHYGHHDELVLNKTLEFMDKLKPKHVVLHDVFDGYSISHHEMKDPFAQHAKEVHNENNLKKEVDELLEGLEPFRKFKNVVIVRSNHDDFIDRWLKNGDWKKQPTPKNSMAYMDYSMRLLRQYENRDVKGIIPELINERFPKFITLGRSDSYDVNGWEVGQHGDIGSNGSRGSLNQFRKMNKKMVVGHYHSPGRKENVMAVGTTTKMRVGYNIGPSSWLQSHVLIHPDGKAQHINFWKDSEGEMNFTTMD
jgi:hypothetical protein